MALPITMTTEDWDRLADASVSHNHVAAWIDGIHLRAVLLSQQWQATHPPVDGDDRSPLEVVEAGLITWEEFWALVDPAAPGASS
jgi:hypothetical protein